MRAADRCLLSNGLIRRWTRFSLIDALSSPGYRGRVVEPRRALLRHKLEQARQLVLRSDALSTLKRLNGKLKAFGGLIRTRNITPLQTLDLNILQCDPVSLLHYGPD